MSSEPMRITDPRVLRAIAHPLRVRLLHELQAAGYSRAADLAGALDVPANQVSFHLRTLAKYGLVEEAPEHARDRRDRVWKATNERGQLVDLEDFDEQAGGPAAVGVYRRSTEAWAHEVVRALFAAADERPADSMAAMSQSAMRLTHAEAQEAMAELREVVQRWSKRGRGQPAAGDDDADAGRSTYLAMLMLQPYPERLRDRDADD